MKRLALTVLTNDRVAALFRPFTRDAAAIFTLHRFADESLGVEGHSSHALRLNLAYLRRHGYNLLSLGALLERLEEGRTPAARSVVFTVDDGYEDFTRIAAPIFAEFDCPVHVFVTTGFLDRMLWLWWDRVEYIFERTRETNVTLDLHDRQLALTWSSVPSRRRAAIELSEALKTSTERFKLAMVEQVAELLGVAPPCAAPACYAPMTWDDARHWSSRGVSFGPHSVTHPIMSRVDDDQADAEIRESWRRVREEIEEALPIFCYPNGGSQDFGDREIQLLRRAGLRGATTTHEDYVGRSTVAATHPDERFRMPRFGYPDDRPSLVKVVSGLERARNAVRATMRR
jgi:peptidoglycan/xylan/chitin deacetylase (PgdA/CDA1 family)